jgi:hypothetical protein
MQLAVVAYAGTLLSIAAIPLTWIPRHGTIVLAAALSFVLAVILELLLFRIGYVPANFPSLGSASPLAIVEEAARALFLYQYVLRGSNSLRERVLFGAVFGWLEFCVKAFAFADHTLCLAATEPMPCVDGLPYLAVAASEAILFQIFITAVNYRDATLPSRLVICTAVGAVLHAVLNATKFLRIEESDNAFVYLTMPTLLILVYAAVASISLRPSS